MKLKHTLIACLAALSGSLVHAAPTLVFSAIPDQDETRLKERFARVSEYLEIQLKTDVRFVPVKSYAAAITAFRNNQVQLAWFGGLSGVKARQLVPGAQAIAQGIEDPNFKSYFIAHNSTGLTENANPEATTLPAEIQGKTFTFGSKGSTSGRLMPEFFLRKQFDQSPDDIFSRVGFSGNHSRTIALVESGAYQVGAVNYKVWDSNVAAGSVDTTKVNIIGKTPGYPDYQWTVRGDLDSQFGEGFTEKLKQALLSMKDPELLNSFPRKGFIPATNEDFQPILEVGKQVGLID
ncbi:putative selenate ABC transporter substrate-binding protein [Aliamphritea spongicola]|uniref:putative selenate ABC transporter substrate-binding protein n=1 Tax=Aliamphritea spongicola TaxID=707589 RepID=UPI00196B9D2D|nr:putative selenate ABC transporter substrate-binding protein [Aliamphritea spongicola]MBN3561380.1 putative selenate ABC transporter substrate-binding protein [Aliamphritea spongicola]